MTDFAPIIALGLMMVVSIGIGLAANQVSERGGFLKGYFLGNRGLGSWSMALTATVMSGGTFMGYPSLVYKYGWVLAIWIASYMMVPLCTFAILGKRLGQISRATGAITLPELLRERFQSPVLGAAASATMILLLAVNLVAQFKAGAIILQKVLPGMPAHGVSLGGQSPAFLYGLGIFTLVVVTYTICGGFLAAVWTDVFQSVLMAIGVLVLFPLTLAASGGIGAGTLAGVHAAGPGFAAAPGAGRDFLPIGLVFSFFCMWSVAGMGQPATLVRLMAFRDTRTLRHAIFLLAIYNTVIYLPLLFTFICARAVLPDLPRSDEAMPTLALRVASPWVAGLILAAPFGAALATVSAFLVQISSALAQDIFHRWLRPGASTAVLRRVSHGGIALVAFAAAGATIHSPEFLQAIIVFSGGASGCAFLAPAAMAAFWDRATARGALWSMLGGVGTVFLLYAVGWALPGEPDIGEAGVFAPYYFLGIAPFVWGLAVSALLGVAGSLADGSALARTSPAAEVAP